jgi:hypothetical protein
MLADRVREEARIRKVVSSQHGLDDVGQTRTSRGRVTNRFVHDGHVDVEREL